jgi:alanyl-tRNA synthetase
MVVKRSFLEDLYLTKCKAIVTEIAENIVKLDKTIFYAFSGGQISDSGTICGINVISVKVTENYDIEYELEEKPKFNVGDVVDVKIDWEKRYELMRLHTAQHVVADFFEKETGINETTGGNIRMGKATLSYFVEYTITDVLTKIEILVNDFIKKDIKIETWTDKEDKNKRWWKCGEFKCPCGGTHVKITSEIGNIKLKRKNGGKNREDIIILLDN